MQMNKEKPRAIRTRSGCLTCRRRKKKCDESRCPDTGGCLRCKNSGYECLGYPKRKRLESMDDLRSNESEDFSTSLDAVTGEASITSPLSAHVIDAAVSHSHQSILPSSSPIASSSCAILGRCILLGQPICQGCLTSIQPVLSPSDPTPDFSFSTPFSSSSVVGSSTSRQRQVLHCLIGYYSAVVTCWVEGCHPHAIVQSVFFKELVQYLFQHMDHDEGLRLSIACCASGYIGGGQLQWPEDLKAIQEWTETLREGATELVDVATTSINPSARHFDDPNGDKLARHSYLDRHLSRHARYLYRMANCNFETTLQLCAQSPNNIMTFSNATRAAALCIEASRMRQYNNILLSAMSQAIFAWAELEVDSYYHDFDQAVQIVNTLFAGVRRIKLRFFNTIDTLGFAVLVWSDVFASMARGSQPYFILDDEGAPSDEQDTSSKFPFHFFNCPSSLLKCLSDLARLRFECEIVPTNAGQKVRILPDRLARQAQGIESTLNSLAAITHPSSQFSGSPNCSEMTRLGAMIVLYTTIYNKGPLHPTIKYCLQCILNLWQYGAKAYCVDVGCSNYLFAIFMASSVAHEARDRVICEEAMNLVGHNESSAEAGRRLIKEIWRRTDETGLPVIWSDIVKEGTHVVAFL